MRRAGHALLVPILALGCARTRQPQPLPQVDALRFELAKPDKYPVRHGLEIDPAPLKQAFGELAVAERAHLGERFATELAALPKTTPPAAPAYGVVVELARADLDPLAEALGLEYVIDPSPERLAMRSLFMTLPVQMARSLGLAASTVGAWMGFLRLAKPVVSECGYGSAQTTICLDYGGLDVFMVTLAARGATWVPEAVVWRQRGRASSPN